MVYPTESNIGCLVSIYLRTPLLYLWINRVMRWRHSWISCLREFCVRDAPVSLFAEVQLDKVWCFQGEGDLFVQGGLGDDLVELIETDAAVPIGVKQLQSSVKYAHQRITYHCTWSQKNWAKILPEVDWSLNKEISLSMYLFGHLNRENKMCDQKRMVSFTWKAVL